MTPTETVAFLRKYNVWRRGNVDDQPMPDPREIGKAIDAAVKMIDRLEAAEKERDELRSELKEVRYGTAVAHDTIKALRAKIEATERQEPVAWARKLGMDLPSFGCVTDLKYRPSDMPESAYMPLYALPGAQPAPSPPDDVMRDAKRYRFLRAAKNIPISTEAARDPIVYDAAIDAAMLAAAPEAKP